MSEKIKKIQELLVDMGIDSNSISQSSSLQDFELDSTEKVDLTLGIKSVFGRTINLADDRLTIKDVLNELERDN